MGQSLCAGFPSPADDFLEGALELPRWLAPNPPATFLWRISGDSMRGAGIFDGDLACVDRSLEPSDGSVVVAAIDAHALGAGPEPFVVRQLGRRHDLLDDPLALAPEQAAQA